jgi:hypothetical protein
VKNFVIKTPYSKGIAYNYTFFLLENFCMKKERRRSYQLGLPPYFVRAAFFSFEYAPLPLLPSHEKYSAS